MSKNQKHVSILAASGDYNLGDELIVESEIEYLQKYHPDARITLFSYDPESRIDRQNIDIVRYFPCRFRQYPFRGIGDFFLNLSTIARSDLLIIGGGGIFFDNESGISFVKVLFQWRMRIWIARLFFIPIVFLGISLEIMDPKNLKRLAQVFRHGDTILPRDPQSTRKIVSLGYQATCISDMVFLKELPNEQKNTKRIHQRIGVSFRSGFTDIQNLVQFTRVLLAEGYEVVFLSHSIHPNSPEHNDLVLYENIKIHLHPDERGSVSMTRTIRETLYSYSELDLVVGMRFHSIILAARSGIPCMSFSYGPKTLSLASELGIEEYMLDMKNWDFARAWETFESLRGHSSIIAEHLIQRTSQIQQKLLQQLESIDILGE